jgi:tetratricopeptide (TPR) repeat protein
VRAAAPFIAALLLCFFAPGAGARPSSAALSETGSGRVLLVLPFDNRSNQPSLEWVREAAAELLSSRFASAGFEPTSRAKRLYALDHLGLPAGFQPSRASSIKLAQTLDADSVVVGDFRTAGSELIVEARLVDVPHLKMGETVTARGEMRNLIDVFDSLAWKLTRELDPSFTGREETFLAAGKDLRPDAYEQYIRGVTDTDQTERIRHLEQAVKLSPGFTPAWMALGREQYLEQQYDEAAQAFAKIGRDDSDALEAGFYRGLSLVFSGSYVAAEKAFAEVARILPLPAAVNDEGVAVSRQGRDATSLFMQAAAADPGDPDYHFNLALSLHRQKNTAAALNELAQCLKLRPSDSEAQSLQQAWKRPAAPTDASAASPNSSPDPLERIERTFDEQAFRQAAFMLDQVEATRMAALSPAERAQKLSTQAKGYLDRGLLLEAERLYREAESADSSFAEAHAGLAEVNERSGDSAAARKEAQAALAIAPCADADLVLARLDLAAGALGQARDEAGEALKLEPANQAAQQLLRQIQTRIETQK